MAAPGMDYDPPETTGADGAAGAGEELLWGCEGCDDCDCDGDGCEGCDCWGAGEGGSSGPCSPSSLALAGAGRLGTAEPAPPVEATVLAPAPAEEDLAASVRPGATEATRAAMPAVKPAAPTTTQRRVRRTRSSAASRASAARERSEPVKPVLSRLPIVPSLSGETVSAQ
jgi:hypothetical protein